MERITKNKKKILRIATFMFIVALMITVVGLIILKYQVEGEKNMPFRLGKIMIISTAEGIHKDESEIKWNLDVVQNNDIYIEIEKNKNYKDVEIIEKITLDNFKTNSNTKIGNINIYKPSSDENKTYEHLEQYKVTDKLEYIGSENTNIKNLEIANQGGTILLRYSIENIGEYSSNEDEEIRHDGTLLAKAGVELEQIQSEVSFDLNITLKSGVTYKGRITLKLPVGNLVNEGTSSSQITDFKDVVFKR